MKLKIITILLFSTFAIGLNAQVSNEFEVIINSIRKKTFGKISVKCIDLDNDGDNDLLFTYRCGEANCFDIYMMTKKGFNNILSEFGNITFDYKDSKDLKPSQIILKSDLNHCCGESPFGSFRQFIFQNDKPIIIGNYVRYNYEDYCKDKLWEYTFYPHQISTSKYSVRITKDEYNVRFSADLENHKADFTCIDNSNIIGQLKENSVITVLAENKGKDHELRTWLYVEIKGSDLKAETCNSPLSYGFKGQKLRGWISDKYTNRFK